MHKKITVLLIPTLVGPPVLAQTGGALEEVVVTAQRREQSLQDVPVSVTAFSGEAVAKLGITEAAQYLQLTPNVSYTEDGQVGARGVSISMRGVSNINTDESAFIQSIGQYVDGFSVSASANATFNPQLQDLARVEVLRGPQGTYFGRNSVGGALNLETVKPTDTFGAKVSFDGRSYETTGSQFGVTGVINVPISDTLMTRGVAYYEDNSGIVENLVPGGGDSGHEYVMGRFSARWLPTDRTTVDWMIMVTDEDQGIDENVTSGVFDTDSVATFFLNNPPGPPVPDTISTALDEGTGFWPENRDEVARTAFGEKNENNSLLTVLNISHDLTDAVTVRSVTGFLDTENVRVFDNDVVPEDLIRRYEEKDAESWSTELRLEITTDRFEWVIGGLYAEDEFTLGKPDEAPDNLPAGGVFTGTTTAVDLGVSLAPQVGDSTAGPIMGPGILDFAVVGALPPLFPVVPTPGGTVPLTALTPSGEGPLCLACALRRNELEGWAIFSDFTWHATAKLDLTFGFRYSEDEVFGELIDFALTHEPRIPDPSDPSGLTPLPTTNEDTFKDFSPRFAVGYQFTDTFRLYGIVSKGYKAGGFSLGFDPANNAPVNERFDDEELWNVEVGFKSEWFDRRLRLNASGFHLEWNDLQLETFFFTIPGDPTSLVTRTINVDEAKADGFDIELVAAPLEGLMVSAGLGYVDTEIQSNDTARLSGNLQVDLQGRPTPRSPEWTWNMTAEYRWPWQGQELYVGGEWIYRDSQFSTIEDLTFQQTSGAQVFDNMGNVLAQVPDRSDGFPFKTPDYHLLNLRAGAVWNEDWEVQVFVNNVFDKEYFTGTGENFGLGGFRLRPHPRYIGGSISYQFGGI